MKVVHVLKRIEMIDEDVKELKKLEKTIARDKSFSTPIYMSIEKQINLLLGERNSLLELKILNPPESYVNEIEGTPEERNVEPAKKPPKKIQPAKPKPVSEESIDDIPMVTQDLIDAKFDAIKSSTADKKDSIKILDIALEKGTLPKREIEHEKKVKFFRENFPTD